ncbi:MAG: S8 family serine peptidase [Flavobacteriales bacterium]
MIARSLLAAAAACLFITHAHAQQRTHIGFELETFLQHADPDDGVDLFLQGDAGALERAAIAHGATVKMRMRNWVSVRMPAGRVRALDQHPALRSIEFTMRGGVSLNDSMRAKTGIDRIQAGEAPLPRAYDGSGVVMGIVDTGLDMDHPDFKDDAGETRVLHYWDHSYPVNGQTPDDFGYGQAWTKAEIDAGDCPATDLDAGGHGTTVAGTAAGNGGATGEHVGAAPASDLVIVATDLGVENWPNTVADGVKYVFDRADELGRPAVVNLSLGSYLGSHDGLDPAALFIDSMLNAAPGRAVVCAAGNSGCFPNYTLRMEVDSDTSFAWIKTNSVNPFTGVPTAYLDFWADTAQMNDVWYSIGADRATGGYAYRGRIPFRNVQGTVDTYTVDTLWSLSGNRLAVCSTFASVRGGQYHLEIALIQPDSAAYWWRVMMTGEGRCDAWGNNGFGGSEIVSLGLPTVAEYPPMVNYVLPTLERGIVDAWACSPHVITVANYFNETNYTACNGNPYSIGGTEGAIAWCSSWGNTRTDQPKPDVAAPGDVTFSAAPLPLINSLQNGSGIFKLSSDCMHVRAGGTSIASPAVAGTAALFLQKCPYATHTLLKQAITSTTFADAFTGDVPNVLFGNGKLDAFAALNTTNFSVQAFNDDGQYCDGDSAQALGEAGFADYLWSDGSTGQLAWSQGEPLTLTVINGQGCLATSDTLFFSFIPAPEQPVISAQGILLSSSAAEAYQWNLNGEPIDGATGQQYEATENGDYTVTITAANGCTATSEVYTMISVGVAGAASSSGFKLWPVPARGTLFVTVDGPSALRYDVIDARGAAVMRGSLRAAGTSLLDIGSLEPGAYTLRALVGDRAWPQRFVVAR